MAWVRVAEGKLRYTGRIDRGEHFAEWVRRDGRATVAGLVSRKRFSLFGKERTVVWELWRELRDAARSPELGPVIQKEVDGYPKLLVDLAYSQSLPQTRTLRRMVVVPRVLVNSTAVKLVTEHLRDDTELARLKGGADLRDYFCVQLVKEIDRALVSISPSPQRPFRSEGEWLAVRLDLAFVWLVPFREGPDWRGHYFLYEPPGGEMRRHDRKETAVRIKELESKLAALSRSERYDILGMAQR